MYIRRKVFSCVEERSFAEEKKDGKKKEWSPIDEEFVRLSNEVDKKIGRDRKISGGMLGFTVGGMVPAVISDLSSNARVRNVGQYAILPAAAVGSYAGWKAGKKYHEKKSGFKADLERYEQLSPRDREKYRQMKGLLW